MEVSSVGSLHVVERLDSVYLYNRLSGEKVQVGDLLRLGATLSFSDVGAAFLADVTGNNLVRRLAKLVCMGARIGTDSQEYFIHGPGGSTWMSDILSSVTPLAIGNFDCAGPSFTIQVYVFPCCAGPARIWWSLQHMARILLCESDYRNYVGRNAVRFEQMVLRCGLGPRHFRASAKVLAWQRASNGTMESPPGCALQYSVASTPAFIIVLMNYILGGVVRGDGADNASRLATAMLDSILGRAFLDGPTKVHVNGVFAFTITDGSIHCNDLPCTLQPGLRLLINRRSDAGSMRLGSLLLEIQRSINRPSRLRTVSKVEATSWMHSLLAIVEVQLEVSLDEDWWRVASCLDLAPNMKASRTRVKSKAYISAVLLVTDKTKEPITPRAFLGSTAISNSLGPAASQGVCPSQGRTAREAKTEKAMRYVGAIRNQFKHTRLLHFTVDGVRAGGDSNELFFAWDAIAGVGAVPPLKVRTNNDLNSAFFWPTRHGYGAFGHPFF
jgi:hypothetical protein